MFGGQRFVRVTHFGRQMAGASGGWFLIGPGLSLFLFGLAILIWPELLAYMVAGLLMVAGGGILAWGWSMRQAQKQMRRHMNNGSTVVTDDDYVRYEGVRRY